VSRHGHSETESELTELTIYISMADYSLADSVNFCLFLELLLFPVLPIIPELFENNRLRPTSGTRDQQSVAKIMPFYNGISKFNLVHI